MAPNECQIPVDSGDGQVALVDFGVIQPGDFVNPLISNDEIWPVGSMDNQIRWVFFKGDPFDEPTPEHPLEAPFAEDTTFTVDLMRVGKGGKSPVLNAMREYAPAPARYFCGFD